MCIRNDTLPQPKSFIESMCLTCGKPSDFDECHYCMVRRENKTAKKLKSLKSIYK